MTEKHDQHYRNLETRGIEPIKAMESVICNGIPESMHPVARRNLNIAQAIRYLLRAGEKEGQSASKDLDKAANYVHRARTGAWMPDAEKPGNKEAGTA